VVGFVFFILGIFIYNEIIVVPLLKAIWFSLKTGECCPMCLCCPSIQPPSKPIQIDSGKANEDETVKAPRQIETV
jgi:hypothetical protein